MTLSFYVRAYKEKWNSVCTCVLFWRPVNVLAFCATLIDLQPMDLDAHVASLVRAIVRAHVAAEVNVLAAESCDVVDSLVVLLGLTAPVLVASVAKMLAAAREESACA